MTTGERVAGLRAAHGDSLRQAARRTGVSHSTIARIEKGEVTGSFPETIARIARGYGVAPSFLFGSGDPSQHFASQVRLLPIAQRCHLLYSVQQRTRLALQFILTHYGSQFPPERIAHRAGLEPAEFHDLLQAWDSRPPDRAACLQLGNALAALTGIGLPWFHWGGLDDTDTAALPQAFARMITSLSEAAAGAAMPKKVEDAVRALLDNQPSNRNP